MFRFATVPYVNAAPLAHFIPEVCHDASVISRKPRELLPELMAGRVDAAILSVVDVIGNPRVQSVEGLGIGADGDVDSVLLRCRRPIAEARTVALDPASMTSNALARVLMEKRFRVSVELAPMADPDGADAAVVIGDRALRLGRTPLCHDLAGEWKALTGMPFVFAVWAHRAGHPDAADLASVLRDARRRGAQAVRFLARLYGKRTGLGEARCLRYLTSCIRYDVGDRQLRAMQLFREMLDSLTPQAEAVQTGKGVA
jgi:predicted solute-binding protein